MLSPGSQAQILSTNDRIGPERQKVCSYSGPVYLSVCNTGAVIGYAHSFTRICINMLTSRPKYDSYVDVCKHKRALLDTPSVQADESEWPPILRDAVRSLMMMSVMREQHSLLFLHS